MYEGAPDYPGQRPLVGDRREVRRDDLLHRPDGDPHVHEVGRRTSPPSTTCPRCGCSARWASRSTPKPGSGITRHRRRTLPHRGHLVADRDRRHHDHAAARRDHVKPGSATFRCPASARRSSTTRAQVARGGGYLTLRGRGRACCAASRATRALRRDLLERFGAATSPATARKRDDDGYFWLLGRVDDVMNVSGHRISHHRGRVRAGQPPGGRRGRGRRQQRRGHRPGDHRLRDAARRTTMETTP